MKLNYDDGYYILYSLTNRAEWVRHSKRSRHLITYYPPALRIKIAVAESALLKELVP